ncbi:MAG: response regulator, partial [Magnetovibrio sp.]|nr:response regulator [Magnetovibrio sp.]
MKDVMDEVKKAKILIVDDKAVNVRLLEMMLSFGGFTNVLSTTDSRDVEGLQKEHDFDLILLDIRMPHMDGFQVMETLSKSAGDEYLSVLVLTAQNDMETRLRALQGGARDFVTKPFDKAEILNRITNMLEVRVLYNERKRQNDVLEEKVQERTLELQKRNQDTEVYSARAVPPLASTSTLDLDT